MIFNGSAYIAIVLGFTFIIFITGIWEVQTVFSSHSEIKFARAGQNNAVYETCGVVFRTDLLSVFTTGVEFACFGLSVPKLPCCNLYENSM